MKILAVVLGTALSEFDEASTLEVLEMAIKTRTEVAVKIATMTYAVAGHA